MPAPELSPGRGRFVLLSQQTFALAVVGAMAVSAAGVVELEIVPPPHSGTARAAGVEGPQASLVSAAPVTPEVRTVPFGGFSAQVQRGTARHPATAEDDAQQISAISPVEEATGYATVGVTWDADVELAEEDITVSVRTRTDGAWSTWQEMHYDPEHQPDPGTTEGQRVAPGTDAVVVGDVDGVQVRAATATGQAPGGLALAIVDPGEDVAPAYEEPAIDTGDLPLSGASAAEGGDAELSAAVTGPAVAAKPQVFSRAQWGANESLRDAGSLRYGEVHAGFVHHTVNANAYAKDDVPSILRGIYAYHTQSLGWSDVGYNFLVDRFGQVWEGRYGGIGRPVVGAHTLGYNDDSFAMSAIGNFETARPSEAMLTAYARLFAWKLSLHGVRADDHDQWVTSRSFRAVNGHRDAGQTACPGRYLYERIPDIRRRAAQLQRPVTARDHDADLGGGPWPDLVVRDRATHHAVVVRTAGQLAFERGALAARGWRGTDLLVAPGDVDGDGTADLLARDASTGLTTLHPGNGAGGLLAASRSYRRFAAVDQLTGVGDFDGNGTPDLVGRRDGALLLWPGGEGDGFGPARTLARSWTEYDSTVGADDFDEDGHPDLVARSGSALFLVGGTGRGVEAPVQLPGRWSGDLVAGRGDASGDGHPDLVVRKAASGLTWVYPGDGAGGLQPRIGGWPRFAGARWLTLAGRLSEDRRPDLLGWNADSRDVRVFAHSGRRNLGRTLDTGIALEGINLLLGVGDWNGDGRGDFMTRGVRGAMWLYAGRGRNRFAAPVRAAADWGRVGTVTAAGDVTGDGYPDLMGRDSSGDVRVHPSNGSTGFRESYVAFSSIDGERQVGVGLLDGDSAPDTVVRRSDGTLWLYSGNGAGGLASSRQVGSGAGRYDWLRGLGQVNGSGRSDLVARSRETGKLWLLPGTRTGFGDRRLIGPGFDVYDLGG